MLDEKITKELYEYGRTAFRLARELESDSSEVSRFVAHAIGAKASRLNITEEKLSKWLQSAYSTLWVRESHLNPGLDLKEVRKFLFEGHKLHK